MTHADLILSSDDLAELIDIVPAGSRLEIVGGSDDAFSYLSNQYLSNQSAGRPGALVGGLSSKALWEANPSDPRRVPTLDGYRPGRRESALAGVYG